MRRLRNFGKAGSALNNCLNKNAYDTKEEAEIVADRQRSIFARPLGVYHCPLCEKYHLTSVPTHKRRNKNGRA